MIVVTNDSSELSWTSRLKIIMKAFYHDISYDEGFVGDKLEKNVIGTLIDYV